MLEEAFEKKCAVSFGLGLAGHLPVKGIADANETRMATQDKTVQTITEEHVDVPMRTEEEPHPSSTSINPDDPDGVESVSDGEHGAVFKLSPDGGLDEIVRLQVHGSRSFIQDEDPRLPQERSSQTHQLPLAHTADTTAHEEPGGLKPTPPPPVQFCRLVADKLVEVGLFQSPPHFFIAVLLKGVQVHLQCAGEEDGLLGRRRKTVRRRSATSFVILVAFQ
ncbi:hypothetical protein EYF80_035838 [Liparis tanakae]|uniref:Uncharacterized protein n=1 Tax=Liparis tanakae TaxID=230148 RepID=A0A4Z2GL41_9TELE|nr:hypothetical protein EYF80_035838 [Liparis tanakae]